MCKIVYLIIEHILCTFKLQITAMKSEMFGPHSKISTLVHLVNSTQVNHAQVSLIKGFYVQYSWSHSFWFSIFNTCTLKKSGKLNKRSHSG